MTMTVATSALRPHTGRPCGPRRRGGFTLIEVLAAMLLVAIVVPVAMQGVALATTAATVARQRGEASALAETKLNELLASGDWQNGNTAGDFGADWPGYHWATEVNPWSDPTQSSSTAGNLEQLDVRVTWQWRGNERVVALSTLVYAGNASGSGSGSSFGSSSGTSSSGSSSSSGSTPRSSP